MENKLILSTKKFIATAMIVVLLLTCAPIGWLSDLTENFAFEANAAASELKEGYYTYKLDEGKVVITAVDKAISGNITIPSKLGGYSVVEIAGSAFYDCNSLTGITIPSTIQTIGYSAFYYCENLKNVTISNGVKTISTQVFGRCNALESVTIPASVTDIDSSAFYCCNSLKNINVASGNKNYVSVSGVLFNKNKTTLISYPVGSANTTYTVPSSVTKISNYAFYNAKNITKITFSSNLVNIGAYSFTNCSALKSVSIPQSVKMIGEGAFQYCEEITSITIPSAITSIEAYTFSGCDKLKNVTLPKALKSIGDSAFSSCINLENIVLPNSIEYIGDSIFSYTPYYYNLSNWDNGVFYFGKYLLGTSSDFKTETYNIKNGTTLIADNAFSYRSNLKKIVLPSSVKIICDSAFRSCSALNNINIPDGVQAIGDKVIYGTAYYNNTAKWKRIFYM